MSTKPYAILLASLALASTGISACIAGMVAVRNPDMGKTVFLTIFAVCFVAITVFHFAKGRRL